MINPIKFLLRIVCKLTGHHHLMTENDFFYFRTCYISDEERWITQRIFTCKRCGREFVKDVQQ